ncbi:uncharacterized protein BDZ99DRAFT_499185 [Mytilinidion resinicola]|uniref:Uncharacterized protein n=1 Tax=Mytilinidion resinicola TaxID=574789 RepID=A0A6A6YIU9_9PEZI|nr:uncharacterized protein BDZ99DRAFT_499185 [Mytilinidion resinicola]KAF2808782.1 hypothetical protein BDZ99DRAFT_499185 [Mytilinidion resinicola]
MRFLALITALVALATTSLASLLTMEPREDPDACFKYNYATRLNCWYNKVPMSQAKSAISKACAAITTCTPLKGPFANSRGSEGNIMAQVFVGKECVMGKDNYLTAAKCEEWFKSFVSSQCGGTDDQFALGAALFICDNSTLSINFQG